MDVFKCPEKSMLYTFQTLNRVGSYNKVFKTIDESVSTASLGQVHFGNLLAGEKVAIKIRYPDIHKAVKTELRIASLFPGIGPVKQWKVNLEAYKTNL